MKKFQVGETDINLYYNKYSEVFADQYGHNPVYCKKKDHMQLQVDITNEYDMPYCPICIMSPDYDQEDVPDLTEYIKTVKILLGQVKNE